MLVVLVEFEIDSSQLDAFMPLMIENAKQSVRQEPGCHQFDVAQNTEKPHLITLYELYDDEAAFELHKKAPHYLSFIAQTNAMITGKAVQLLTRRHPSTC